MFVLPELKFKYNALEGFLSEESVKTHYFKHHKAYTDNFNKICEQENILNKEIEDIFSEIEKYNILVRNNGGGYYNHKLFWNNLTDKKTNLVDELTLQVKNDFGSIEKLHDHFNDTAMKLFGSGWVWMVWNRIDKKIEIINTKNQDNPLMSFVLDEYDILLCLDLWEHSYYIDYKERKKDYIENFWNYVDWDTVSRRFLRIIRGL